MNVLDRPFKRSCLFSDGLVVPYYHLSVHHTLQSSGDASDKMTWLYTEYIPNE